MPEHTHTPEAEARLAWLRGTYGHLGPALQAHALKLGGDAVVLTTLPFTEATFLERAQQYGPSHHFAPGRPSGCHTNTHDLVAGRPDLRAVTGLALSTDPDGLRLWRVHSWAADQDGRVTETTTPREAYLGVPLTDHERALWLS